MKKHRPKPASRRKPTKQAGLPTQSRDRHRLMVDPVGVHRASFVITDAKPETFLGYDVLETVLTRDYFIPKVEG